MAITREGTIIDPKIEALGPDDGFIVRLQTSYRTGNDKEKRAFEHKGQDLNIFGDRLNGHEDTWPLAITRVKDAIDAFGAELNQFITDWNSGTYNNE